MNENVQKKIKKIVENVNIGDIQVETGNNNCGSISWTLGVRDGKLYLYCQAGDEEFYDCYKISENTTIEDIQEQIEDTIGTYFDDWEENIREEYKRYIKQEEEDCYYKYGDDCPWFDKEKEEEKLKRKLEENERCREMHYREAKGLAKRLIQMFEEEAKEVEG